MYRPPQLLGTAALFLASLGAGFPSPADVEHQPRQESSLSMWVTVNKNGQGQTITPTVTTIDGAASTISAPPSDLTKTTTFVVTISGTPTTTSGLPPVATATGSALSGAFLVCSNQLGVYAPFCQPQDGVLIGAGKTYYVTWDTTFFTLSNTSVQVQGNFEDVNNSTSDGGKPGFSSEKLSASQGFYVWEPDFILQSQNVTSVDVQLVLAIFGDDDVSLETERLGPTVHLTNSTDADSGGEDSSDGGGGGGSHAPSPLIAIPIVLGLAVLGLLGFCVWSWRRHGRVPVVGGLVGARRRSMGYGERQSRAQRVAAGKNNGIQLADRESWSPSRGGAGGGQGRNVFREELRRQEQEAER